MDMAGRKLGLGAQRDWGKILGSGESRGWDLLYEESMERELRWELLDWGL